MRAKYFIVKNENLIKKRRPKTEHTIMVTKDDFIRIVGYYKEQLRRLENGWKTVNLLRSKIRELEWDLASKQSEINILKENQNAILHNN